MKQGRSIKNNHRKQRGDALIEALIGVLLMSVIGLGLSYATSRAVFAQRYVNTQNIAVAKMREAMSTSSSASTYCASTFGPVVVINGTSSPMTLSCTKGSVSIGVVSTSDHLGANNTPSSTTLGATLGAGSMVTSLTMSMPANATNAAIVGGDGSMGMSF